MRDPERSVYGCDYGGNGGATRSEAEQVYGLLELGPGVRLLHVGAGSGWPALSLAQISGCNLVMVDIPLASLRIARERAVADGLAQRCEIIAADAAALPFKDASFDAFNHADVLCCTPDKLGVQRSCRRVARWRQDDVHDHRPRTMAAGTTKRGASVQRHQAGRGHLGVLRRQHTGGTDTSNDLAVDDDRKATLQRRDTRNAR